MPTEVSKENMYLLDQLADLANMKDDLWKYHPDNPQRINVVQEYAKICAQIAGIEGELAALHQ
jgi:predicted Zn-dependent protease|tara:strand:- start:551 stop:739 length:189 start_codon:yes stop_codon:yes gene_type:complete